MKKFLIVSSFAVILILAAIAIVFHEQEKQSAWNAIKNPETVKMLKRFVAMKEAQADASTNTIPPEIQSMFKDANHGNWLALSNSFAKLNNRIRYWNSLGYGTEHWHGFRGAVEDFISYAAGKIGSPLPWNYWAPPRLQGTPGEAIKEVYGAFDSFVMGDKYAVQFGREVISSIPAGSIYFGGTDPGRFLITGMEKSQVKGDPFFLLSQNPLSDSSYLDYVRNLYGDKIYLPTAGDLKKAFADYSKDAMQRIKNHHLKPGEGVKQDAAGRIQITGHVSVMELNGLLAKEIFDRNTNREFYIEESFPLDWMYPYLEPHGLIFKINRQPLNKLSDEIVQRDHNYWTKMVSPMMGDWLNDNTPVSEIAAFAKKVFARHDFNGFTGDREFVQNDYACRMFSKERASSADLYVWRMNHATLDAEKANMTPEADFAFRQAWAICPYSSEVVFQYINFLQSQNRWQDALLVAKTAATLPQCKNDEQIKLLPAELKQVQQNHSSKPVN